MLTVGARKQRALATESSFEDAFSAALDLKSWHMSCTDKGWPDRYVTGGIWIEFKVLKDGWADQLYKEQRTKLTELARAGNPTFYCALTQDHMVIFEPWLQVKGKFLKTVPRHKYRTKKDLKEIFNAGMEKFREHQQGRQSGVQLPLGGHDHGGDPYIDFPG